MVDRELRTTFDQAAAGYHAARPDYPERLFDDLSEIARLHSRSRLLEIGCGTGKATVPLARRGFQITGLELGESLAREAARNLHGFGDVRVVNAPFEHWDAGRTYDLVYAATSWHWVDPDIAYVKAAAALEPDGHLGLWDAYHAFPPDMDPFFAEIQDVYDDIGHGHPGAWPPPLPEHAPDLAGDFEASGLFEPVAVRRYVWEVRYTVPEYLALLDTFSNHIAMERDKRDHLYGEIRRLLADRPGGSLTRHWVAVLTVGRR